MADQIDTEDRLDAHPAPQLGPALAVGPLNLGDQGAGLQKGLSAFGVLLLTLSCLSPVFSIYGVGSDILQHAGTGSAALFLIGIGAAIVWAVVYAELGSAYPYAGADYVGVGSILGGWAGATTLALWTITAGPSIAFEARVIATYVGELAPSIPSEAIVFSTLILSVIIALLAVRIGALVTGAFLLVEMLAVLALAVAGFWRPVRGLTEVLSHPVVFHQGLLAPVGIGVMALSGLSAVYGTVGGNQAIAFGEELEDPHRRIGWVVLAAGLIGGLATGLPVIAVVLGAKNLRTVLGSSSPLAAFVTEAAGPIASHTLSAGVALAIFNAVIVQIMTSARLYYSLGRDRIFSNKINNILCRVHRKSGVPRPATLIVGVFSAGCCFLSTHLLLVFITGLLVYGWSLVCLAVLVGRFRGQTALPGYWRSPLFPLFPVLGLIMAVIFTLSDLADADAGRPSLVLLGLVVAAAVLWCQMVLKRRPGGWAPSLAHTDLPRG